jgi:hypothetical protein
MAAKKTTKKRGPSKPKKRRKQVCGKCGEPGHNKVAHGPSGYL